MSIVIMLGNELRRDRFWLSLPVAEKMLRALVVYLSTLIERGRIRHDGLAKELLIESEYLMAGRRLWTQKTTTWRTGTPIFIVFPHDPRAPRG
jgi:hypothetical protein